MARGPADIVAEWRAQVASLKEELGPFESGEIRFGERRGDEQQWRDTTQEWIDRLRRNIDLYERMIVAYERDHAARS